MGHINAVCRVELDKRSSSGNATAYALIYDEHRRRHWARRAERGDPTLNIQKEAWLIDEELLKAVGTRLKTTLAAAGLNAAGDSSGAAGTNHATLSANKESAFAKQAAAIEAQTRKAEAANRGMQQQQFRAQNAPPPRQFRGNTGHGNAGKGGKGFGKGGGKSHNDWGKRPNHQQQDGRRVIPRQRGR